MLAPSRTQVGEKKLPRKEKIKNQKQMQQNPNKTEEKHF
jgi:hypothetical protein